MEYSRDKGDTLRFTKKVPPNYKKHRIGNDEGTRDKGRSKWQLHQKANDTYEDYIENQCFRYGPSRRQGERANEPFYQHCLELYKKQAGLCAITGVPMTYSRGYKVASNISIDRIDNKKGYEIGNVRLVSQWVNNAMGIWGEDTLYWWVKQITAHISETQKPLLEEGEIKE
jgi:hypothetical protein